MLPPLRHDYLIRSAAFSPDGSKIFSYFYDNWIIRVWDARPGIVLPHRQITTDDTPRPAMDKRVMGWWLPNINTGGYMGALPVGVNFHSGQIRGSTYVGWTSGFQLVLVHFPEQ